MTAHWPIPAGLHTSSAQLPVEGALPSFDGATDWLNSPPLTPAGRTPIGGPPGCGSTSGRWRATGRWRRRPPP